MDENKGKAASHGLQKANMFTTMDVAFTGLLNAEKATRCSGYTKQNGSGLGGVILMSWKDK